jgi:hypothetical protein
VGFEDDVVVGRRGRLERAGGGEELIERIPVCTSSA